MFIKISLILLFVSTLSYATQENAKILAALSANPQLLDTPQAQAEMQKRGISKYQVLKKLNSTNNNNEELDTTSNTPLNDLSFDDSNQTLFQDTNLTLLDTNTTIEEEKEEDQNVFQNPLLYKQNDERLQEIRAKQNLLNEKKELERISKVFFTNKNEINPTLLSVPSYYIINKNDTISLWIYGGVNKNIETKVDNNGNINIETLGPIKVAGLEYKEMQNILSHKLSKAFSGAKVAVNISELSTIQVTLTGYANNIGVYNIASLSTLKNLLIASHGVKENGSIRNITIERKDSSIEHIDFYDLFSGQKTKVNTLLRNGDIIYIPKAKAIVSIDGAISTPALFELKENETLKDLLYYAGNIKTSASKNGIKITTFKDQNIKTFMVSLQKASSTILHNEDSIYVYPIDTIHKNSIALYGNVVRPGEREVITSLHKLFQNEIDQLGLKGVFLENTLFSYAIIKSLQKNLSYKVEKFNLAAVISGNEDVTLHPNDEVYIFNKLDTEVNQFVEIFGEVVTKQGQYQYFDGLSVYDVIKMAGTSRPYDLDKIKITTYNTSDKMPEIKIISLEEAQNFKLHPYDVIDLYDYYDFKEISTVNIAGEIYLPNTYTYNKNMTLQELIKIAGGTTQKAYLSNCEIVRYTIVNEERVKKVFNVNLRSKEPIKIQPHDEITVRSIPNWSERKTVTLKGEVKFPGEYVIENGDKLSDVIDRAGGFTQQAFLYGAVFTRESIKELQRQKLKEAILKLKQKAFTMSTAPREAGQSSNIDTLKIANVIDSLSKEAEKLQPIGRVSIKIEQDLEKFKNKPYNLILKDKDTLTIPSFNDTVLVMGQVMNPTAIVFNGDDDIEGYIEKAGGVTSLANEDEIYVIHANGESHRYNNGFFSSNVDAKKGDVIIVSQKMVTSSTMQIIKDVSDILYKLAITTASLATVGAI